MKTLIKPKFEKILLDFGSSFSYRNYNKNHQNKNQNFWHYHPEIELVYVNGGSGKRQIGSHISHYREGDLILIGSGLPHCGFTDILSGNQSETVVQLTSDFLGISFFEIPEMKNVKALLETSRMGIVYHGDEKKKIGLEIEKLIQLHNYEKLFGLLKIFQLLAEAKNYTILNAQGFILEAELQDTNKINVFFNYVKEEFHRPIPLEEIAGLANMTVPSFCRYFKKITGKTFIQFVNEYRLMHAAKLLHEEQMSILDVCFESGFNNFSHFNKQFKKFTGKNPSFYRNELKYVVS
jgi:AraC-like DNA-binding protein